jgi:hypothetical protein
MGPLIKLAQWPQMTGIGYELGMCQLLHLCFCVVYPLSRLGCPFLHGGDIHHASASAVTIYSAAGALQQLSTDMLGSSRCCPATSVHSLVCAVCVVYSTVNNYFLAPSGAIRQKSLWTAGVGAVGQQYEQLSPCRTADPMPCRAPSAPYGRGGTANL